MPSPEYATHGRKQVNQQSDATAYGVHGIITCVAPNHDSGQQSLSSCHADARYRTKAIGVPDRHGRQHHLRRLDQEDHSSLPIGVCRREKQNRKATVRRDTDAHQHRRNT